MNRSASGQALPYMLVMMVVLIISWAMMLNVAQLLTDRMIMQNAVDNAALSAAVCKARLLNKLGQLNYLIGCALYGTEYGITNYNSYGVTGGVYGICPQVVGAADFKCFTDTQKKIGSVLDASHSGCTGMDNGSAESERIIVSIRNLVNGLIKVQDALIAQYRFEFDNPVLSANRMYKIAQRQDQINVNSKIKYIIVINPESLSLNDIVRNENGIDYCKTKSICISVPPNPITPAGIHGHAFWTADYVHERKSWLYADQESFFRNQKIIVVAGSNNDSESTKGYPVFGKWIGLSWPAISVTAAAAVYNTQGPMFTVEQKGRPSDEISPVIKAYKRAEKGGWDAHLVPVEDLGIMH